MKEKRNLILWIKKNRKALIAAGITISVIIGVILGIRNADEIKAVWDSLRGVTAKPAVPAVRPSAPAAAEPIASAMARSSCTVPFDVSAHLRNLSEGRHASAAKVASALDNGFVLKDGQTWVQAFTKGKAA